MRRRDQILRIAAAGVSALAVLFYTAVCLGQASPSESTGSSTAQSEQAAGDVGTDASKNTEGAGDDQSAGESEQSWGKARGIYVVQKRPFQKQGRFALSLYGGMIPNNIFEQYYPVGLRANYYLLENLGLELSGAYTTRSDSGLKDQLKEGVNTGSITVGDRQRFHSNFSVLWSPFYGKTAFYNSDILYFDVYLSGGVGIVFLENTEPGRAVEQTRKVKGVLGGGFAFYTGKHFATRIDYRQSVFQKVRVGGLARPSEVSLGFSWFF